MIRDAIGFGLSQLWKTLSYYPEPIREDVLREYEDLREYFALALLERGLSLDNVPEENIKDIFRSLGRAIYQTAKFCGWKYTRTYGWVRVERWDVDNEKLDY